MLLYVCLLPWAICQHLKVHTHRFPRHPSAVCVYLSVCRVGSYSVGWSQVFSFTTAPSSSAVAANQASFTFLVFNDVGQENAILFDNICPPYCPAGWAFEPYTANSTKLLRHLTAEADARLGLIIGRCGRAPSP